MKTAQIICFAIFLSMCRLGEAQQIIAHRGASHLAPENTISAFRLAWQKGADGIEGDFRLTKDNQIVCIHDKNTKRVSKTKLIVKKSTLSQLRKLDVGRWKAEKWKDERIPTLREVLETVPATKTIFIEIKSGVEIIKPLKVALAKSPLKPKQMVIISFNHKVIAQSKRAMPHLKAIWITSYKQNRKTKQWKPAMKDILRTLRQCSSDGLDTQANLAVIDSKFVAAIRRRGLELHGWTVNDPARALRLRKLGFDSITTNRPGFLRKKLADFK